MTPETPWLDLLKAQVARLGSRQAVADDLDYSRAAISQALSGKYPAHTTRLAAAVIAAYSRCDCPYLRQDIAAAECRRFRTRPIPRSVPEELRHWTACQGCPVGAMQANAEAIRRKAC